MLMTSMDMKPTEKKCMSPRRLHALEGKQSKRNVHNLLNFPLKKGKTGNYF